MNIKDFEKENFDLFPCGLNLSRRQKTILDIWGAMKGKAKGTVRRMSAQLLEKAATVLLQPEDITWLVQKGINLNAPLSKGYRFADLLAKENTLTPQLISKLAENKYDFKMLNERGRHCGYYIEANKHLVAALKAQGLDFSASDGHGVSAADSIAFNAIKNNESVLSLFETREDMYDCVKMSKNDLKNKTVRQINAVQAEINPNIDYAALRKEALVHLFRANGVRQAYNHANTKSAPNGLKENHPFWERMKQENQNKR